ncbi:MAG TPA: class I SAM-dependent methyltransferase [Methanospirillum sp.]|nr:class I SAM-dependent methyltransferase [Methanospirillum sp.]
MTYSDFPRFLFSFYEALSRQGPGDDAVTRNLLHSLPDLPDNPQIIDMGSGSGAQTLVLAQVGQVTAIDIYQPFLNRLMVQARVKGLSSRITPILTLMDNSGIRTGVADLIWSEGAVYIIGFARGLILWRDLVRPGGYVVVSEMTRLDPSPPPEIEAYWNTEYPGIQDIAGNCHLIKEAGYTLLSIHPLPGSAFDAFYASEKEQIDVLKANELTNEETSLLDMIEEEIRLYKRYPDSYGYVFFLMQRPI